MILHCYKVNTKILRVEKYLLLGILILLNRNVKTISQSLAEKSLKGVFNTSINSDAFGNILLARVDVVMVSVVSISNNVILSQPFIGADGNWYTQAKDLNGNIIKNKSCIVTYYYI